MSTAPNYWMFVDRSRWAAYLDPEVWEQVIAPLVGGRVVVLPRQPLPVPWGAPVPKQVSALWGLTPGTWHASCWGPVDMGNAARGVPVKRQQEVCPRAQDPGLAPAVGLVVREFETQAEAVAYARGKERALEPFKRALIEAADLISRAARIITGEDL